MTQMLQRPEAPGAGYTQPSIDAVIKISGSLVRDGNAKKMYKGIADYADRGTLPVVFVGEGEQIDEACRKAGVPIIRDGKYRVTDARVLAIVQEEAERSMETVAKRIRPYGAAVEMVMSTSYEPLIFAERSEHMIEGQGVGYFGELRHDTPGRERRHVERLIERIHDIEKKGAIPVVAVYGHQWADEMPAEGYQGLNIEGDSLMQAYVRAAKRGEERNITTVLFATREAGLRFPVQKGDAVLPIVSSDYVEQMKEENLMDPALYEKLVSGFAILNGGVPVVGYVGPENFAESLEGRVQGTQLVEEMSVMELLEAAAIAGMQRK